MNKLIRGLALLFAIAVFGGFSGQICGFIILSGVQLTGNSGTIGFGAPEHWNAAFCWWWAGWIGQPVGMIAVPIAYLGFLSSTPILKSYVTTMFGTIAGGCLGALGGPITAILFSCIGFGVASLCLFDRQTMKRMS